MSGWFFVYDQYKTLDKKLNEIIEKSQYDYNDSRNYIFRLLRTYVMWIETMFHIMHAEYVRKLPAGIFEDIFGIGYQNQTWWRNLFQTIVKDAFMSLCNFVIENFFITLLIKLEPSKEPPIGYYTLAKELLSKTSIPNADFKLKVLNTLALYRNVLHYDVHTPTHPNLSNFKITVKGYNFEFIKDKPVQIALPELVILLEEIVDILAEIVESQEVTKISGLIPFPLHT